MASGVLLRELAAVGQEGRHGDGCGSGGSGFGSGVEMTLVSPAGQSLQHHRRQTGSGGVRLWPWQESPGEVGILCALL